MALVRQWYPSPNYSSSRSRNQLVIVHTSEGSTSQTGLAGFLAQPSSGVSYQVCYDDAGDPNVIVECVRTNNKAWAAMNANDWGVHGCCCTPSGASQGWSRDVWMSKPTMLRKCASWIAEEAAKYGIPLVKVNANDINAGRKGVCGHGDVSAAGAGGSHTDPGPNFPWDHVIALASGGAPIAPPEEADLDAAQDQRLKHVEDMCAALYNILTYGTEASGKPMAWLWQRIVDGTGDLEPKGFGALSTLDQGHRDQWNLLKSMEAKIDALTKGG